MSLKVGSKPLTPTQPKLETDAAGAVKTTPVELKKPDAYSNEGRRAEEAATPRTETTPQVFTDAQRAELSKKIPCPALSGMFNAGMIKADKDGVVNVSELNAALTQLGLGASVRETLTHGADATDAKDGKFNLFKLNGSNLDHTGSSGIRQNGVHPERFELMKSFSSDGKTLTPHDLSEAAKRFAKESPGFKGGVIQLLELAILLETFGKRDEHNKPFFTFADAESLFVHGKIPADFNMPAVPGTVSKLDVFALAAKMKIDQIF